MCCCLRSWWLGLLGLLRDGEEVVLLDDFLLLVARFLSPNETMQAAKVTELCNEVFGVYVYSGA